MLTLAQFYGPEAMARMDEPLPEDLVSYRSCREYFERESIALANLSPAGTDVCPGAQWYHGPLRFEKYVGDCEPAYDPTGKLRFVVWQRIERTDKPAGWKTGLPGLGFRMTGFSRVENRDGRNWSPHAKRHLAHWKKLMAKGEREIVFDLSLEEYLDAYALADQDRTMKSVFPNIIREKIKAHGRLLHLIGSRRPGGPIDAGFCYLHIPEARQSTHVSAFMAGDAKKDSASTGLIAQWFEDCAAAGIPYLDFGFFWAPGDPSDWHGFSRFKSQFAVRLIQYPRALYRWYGESPWKTLFKWK